MRTLLTVVLLSSLAFAQGIGGKGGVGGKGGFGGGASAAPPVPAFVRGNATSASCSPCTSTFPSNSAGDLLVVAVEDFGNTVSGCSDSANGAYTLFASGHDTNVGYFIYLFYLANSAASAGTNTITCNTSGSSFTRMGNAEYSGVLTSSPADGVGLVNVNQTGVAPSSGAYSATTGDLAIGWGFANANGMAAGAGWNGRATATIDSNVIFEDQIVAGGTTTATATSNNGDWSMMVVAFKP